MIISRNFIGCCGAYCKTCKPYIEGFCKGCKLGYDSGERDIATVKCRIKLCCFRENGLETCADCSKLETCEIIGGLYAKNGYKYKKYKQAVKYIKENGYPKFLDVADKWNGPYGKY